MKLGPEKVARTTGGEIGSHLAIPSVLFKVAQPIQELTALGLREIDNCVFDGVNCHVFNISRGSGRRETGMKLKGLPQSYVLVVPSEGR